MTALTTTSEPSFDICFCKFLHLAVFVMEISVWRNDFCDTIAYLWDFSTVSKGFLFFPTHQVTQYSNSIHIHVNCLNFLSDDVNPNEHHHFWGLQKPMVCVKTTAWAYTSQRESKYLRNFTSFAPHVPK